MKHHASHGADILAGIKFPYPVVPIVRHHHEQWNGMGYPSALVGTAIPIGARILSVVDCFDALTSDLGEIARGVTPPLESCLSVPIVLDGTLLGVISLYGARAAGWNDDHRRVVEAGARQLASTMKRCVEERPAIAQTAATSGSSHPVVH